MKRVKYCNSSTQYSLKWPHMASKIDVTLDDVIVLVGGFIMGTSDMPPVYQDSDLSIEANYERQPASKRRWFFRPCVEIPSTIFPFEIRIMYPLVN